jgi:hypothetical protein
VIKKQETAFLKKKNEDRFSCDVFTIVWSQYNNLILQNTDLIFISYGQAFQIYDKKSKKRSKKKKKKTVVPSNNKVK